MTSLKSFIKAVRAAKTLADERAVIQKESAAIRTSFREDYTDQHARRQNVAKLLYLFTLGERTHFGQVECLKLLGSPRFTDKRLGYLGTMLLLDESQEVITLVTNSLANDLAHPNQYVVALALCTLANIASTEMARDLYGEIDKILNTSNPYLRKKAALCAMRIVSRVPDLSDVFGDRVVDLLNDKNHGVLLCAVSLACEMCYADPDNVIPRLRNDVLPILTRHLKALSAQGYAPEHDVLGVTDPFLQVRLMKLLRIIGQDSSAASEQMSDVLAHIASGTDPTKNVGCSVLYEAVLTILGIEADPGLRVLGVNILGKFLTNKDNNTRYVALNTLLRVIEVEPTAVQRHRATIVECLQDADISIRRRALELSYALITEQNVRVMVRELLTFLETADLEFRQNIVSQIAIAAEKYAPNKRWHVDTLLRALKLAGDSAKENVLSAFITLVISAPSDLQLYTVQKLYVALTKDITQQGLTLVGVWMLGEFGHILLQQGNNTFEEEELVQKVGEEDVINLIEKILNSLYATDIVREYVVNALIKLSVRLNDARQIERIRRLLEENSKSLNVEVQQRVAEYLGLLNADISIRKGVLETMPAPEVPSDLAVRMQKKKVEQHKVRRPGGGVSANGGVSSSTAAATAKAVDLLLDFGDTSGSSEQVSSHPLPQQQAVKSNSDLLSDIFGSSSGPSTASPASPAASLAASKQQNILDLFGPSPSAATPPPNGQPRQQGGFPFEQPGQSPQQQRQAQEQHIAFSDSALQIKLAGQKDANGGSCSIMATFVNVGTAPLSNISLQVAVPKSQKLQLQALSSSNLGAAETATQKMRISGAAGSAVRLRMRVGYGVNGNEVKEQVDFKFPEELL